MGFQKERSFDLAGMAEKVVRHLCVKAYRRFFYLKPPFYAAGGAFRSLRGKGIFIPFFHRLKKIKKLSLIFRENTAPELFQKSDA